MEFDISDDGLHESDYDGGSDSASQLLKPFIPLGVSPQKARRGLHIGQQPRQRSILSDRDLGSSSRYYLSSVRCSSILSYITPFLIVGPARTPVT